MAAWFIAHVWWFIGGIVGFFCLIMERMAYHRGISEGIDRVRREREAFQARNAQTQEIARRSWDQLAGRGVREPTSPEIPASRHTGEGQGGYTIEPFREGQVRLTFQVQPGESQEGMKLQVVLPAEAADKMGDDLKTSAAGVAKECETRPTAWDRVKAD